MQGPVFPYVVCCLLMAAGGLIVAQSSCAGGQLTPRMQCRLDSLEVLPSDPNMATVYDAVDVIERLIACERLQPDGGL